MAKKTKQNNNIEIPQQPLCQTQGGMWGSV
uniref:Uncharacterized protein n=1 Tax=Anguilla anguilla TaxID=7936 RepID=A0A0E9W4N1_ANGAN